MPAWITSELRELVWVPKALLGLQHHDLAPAHRQPARDGEADHAGADHGAFDSFCHNPVNPEKLVYFTSEKSVNREW